MAKTLVYMRTHIIDKGVISEFLKLKNTCGYDCVLLIDNHTGEFANKSERRYIQEIEFLGHKINCFLIDDILYNDYFNLPYYTEDNNNEEFGKMMWYCADYVFYALRKFFPEYDNYWQFEYDVFCNGESYEQFFKEYDSRNEDLIIANLEKASSKKNCIWAEKVAWVYDIELYTSFFPLVRISGRAIDYLLERRLYHKQIFDLLNPLNRWIFCEIFVPTELINAGFSAFSIDDQNLRYIPNYDLNEDRIFEKQDNKIYHPVRAKYTHHSNILDLSREDILKVYRICLFGFKFSLVIQKFH